tara:strand:- start:110 stop:379 length:270 start_codon:yes stop_codon:yes gene_type:complete
MEIAPRNRYILVEPRAEEDKENSILLPEDYSPSKPRHESVKVLQVSADCSIRVSKGDTIIVDSSMIEKIIFEKEELHFILENYVLASVN